MDGVPEVVEKVREQLFQGASQIKLAVGGGVSPNFDPIDVTQFSPEEILNLLADPAKNLAVIMKDGVIFKDAAGW